MEMDHEVDNLEIQFATISLYTTNASSVGGVGRSVILRRNPPIHSNPILMPIQICIKQLIVFYCVESYGVCRSWPGQGKLPQCFNVDMSSSKVSSSTVLLTLNITCCILQLTVLLEVLGEVLGNDDIPNGRHYLLPDAVQLLQYIDITVEYIIEKYTTA